MTNYNTIYEKSKRVIQGLCGSGKSHSKQEEIAHNNERYLWVVQSTKQAIDALKRFKAHKVDASIIVCQETYNKYPEYQDNLHLRISATTGRVIIITMASFLLNSYSDDLNRNGIKIYEVIVDEVEVTDIVRPNLLNIDISSLWSNKTTGVKELYDTNFSRNDYTKALALKNKDIRFNFLTQEITNCKFNITILTTETLISKILEYGGFTVSKYVRDSKLEDKFKNEFYLNIKHSKLVVVEYLKTKEFSDLSKKYDYVIGNRLDKVETNYNLKSSKGLDLIGNNLVIVRNLVSDYLNLITTLLTNLSNFTLTEKEITKFMRICYFKQVVEV